MSKPCPIEHLSYSSVCTFLRNRWEFKKRYIDKIYDDKESPATLVGKSFHKCLELYYSGIALEQARESSILYLSSRAQNTDFGKTGSLDKALAELTQTIDHYFSEEHGYEGTKVETEKMMKVSNKGWKLTLKAISDLIVHKEDGT